MNYSLLHSLLQELEEFESQKSDSQVTLDAFRIYLNEQHYLQQSPQKLMKKKELETSYLDNDLCKQVIMLGRYTKFILRKGMDRYPELVNEDFTYLYRLMDYDSLTKMQLIEKNSHEKQSGLEIIKRLLKHGLIREFQNPDDGRSKRIAVTEEGKKLFYQTIDDVDIMSQILTGTLDEQEKITLLELLKKLNGFHQVVYTEHKNDSIEEIKKLADS